MHPLFQTVSGLIALTCYIIIVGLVIIGDILDHRATSTELYLAGTFGIAIVLYTIMPVIKYFF